MIILQLLNVFVFFKDVTYSPLTKESKTLIIIMQSTQILLKFTKGIAGPHISKLTSVTTFCESCTIGRDDLCGEDVVALAAMVLCNSKASCDKKKMHQ